MEIPSICHFFLVVVQMHKNSGFGLIVHEKHFEPLGELMANVRSLIDCWSL